MLTSGADRVFSTHEHESGSKGKDGKVKVRIFFVVIVLLAFSGLLAVAQSGQDVVSLKDTSKKVWKDSKSGLTWQVSPTGGRLIHEEALTHCKSLSLDDQSDWRLPTISELRSLVRGCPGTQKGRSCKVTDSCLNYKNCRDKSCGHCPELGGPGSHGAYWLPELSGMVSWYWSSSSVTDDKGAAWNVFFSTGSVDSNNMINDYYVRCVH
jgi:Protein of unknown function (DUF1566)